MENLKEMLAGQIGKDYWDWDFSERISYEMLVKSMGYDIDSQETFGSYQGDIIFVVWDRPNARRGILICGYGSCSGCDAIEGIISYGKLSDEKINQLTALRDSLAADIMWEEQRGGLMKRVEQAIENNSGYWLYEPGEKDYVIAMAKKYDEAY